jgi:hypothetical protein
MKTIKNYNSCNPLSTYKLGDTRAFYINNSASSRLVKANSKDAAQYAKALDKVIKDNPRLLNNSGKYHKLIRAIGVVVEKRESVNEKGVDMITVMFKTTDGYYVLNKYAVGTKNVLLNEKDYVQPAVIIDISAL